MKMRMKDDHEDDDKLQQVRADSGLGCGSYTICRRPTKTSAEYTVNALKLRFRLNE